MVLTTRIILCLATLELWLPDNNSFIVIFAATKDKFDYLLKKLFHSVTLLLRILITIIPADF